jgi:hypothetical protein
MHKRGLFFRRSRSLTAACLSLASLMAGMIVLTGISERTSVVAGSLAVALALAPLIVSLCARAVGGGAPSTAGRAGPTALCYWDDTLTAPDA